VIRRALPVLLALAAGCAAGSPVAPGDEGWTSLFDGKSLGAWKKTEYGGEGDATVADGSILIEMGASLSGVHWTGAPLPPTNYELELEAMKVDGSDFFLGVVFPVGKSHCSFVAGGWGGSVTGLSSVDQMNASENDTSTVQDYAKNRWYRARLKVTPAKIEAWINEKQVVDLDLKDKQITVHPSVEAACPFGLATYTTTARYRGLRWRKVE
jgi:hypothetical protein